MRILFGVLAASLILCIGLPAAAQRIGVLQSAETMDQGVYKVAVAPIMVIGKNGADDEFGVVARGGYGFTDRFDAEAKLGFFENITYIGADGELWILKNAQPNAGLAFSVTGGIHWMFASNGNFDTMGFDVTPQFSGHVSENLELCGALDATFESIKDAPPMVDDTFTTLHLVPGIEYRLSDTADFVGEVGIGLNDDSFTYVGLGFAFYRR